MKCPLCQGPMQAGSASISRTTTGMVLDVLTGDHRDMPSYLFFNPTGCESICIDHSRGAYRCTKCEAVLIAGVKEPRPKRAKSAAGPPDATCPACGADIHAQDRRCPSCDIALT